MPLDEALALLDQENVDAFCPIDLRDSDELARSQASDLDSGCHVRMVAPPPRSSVSDSPTPWAGERALGVSARSVPEMGDDTLDVVADGLDGVEHEAVLRPLLPFVSASNDLVPRRLREAIDAASAS